MPSKRSKKPVTHLLDSYHLLSYEEVDSTNEEAKRIAAAGGGHGAVLWSKEQTSGRGRSGRPWVSQNGNLFVSILLSPEAPQALWPQISFVAALTVYESVKPLLPNPESLALKWPNDILVDGKKLGGILLESFTTSPEDGGAPKSWVAVGIGVNVEHAPEGTETPASSLMAEGVEIVSAKIVLSRLIHHFIETYDEWENKGFKGLHKAWSEVAYGVGLPMQARLPNETLIGTFEGIDAEGHCQLRLSDDSIRSLSAGDVFFPPAPANDDA